MQGQGIVIGLGLFGMSVARTLSEKGMEVLAVDVDEERVQLASSFAAEVACFDAGDERALEQTGPERRDVCVCAIGDEAREASIITTALLRQMGAKRIIARANTDVHARILSLVGAHEVVNPEREFGVRFANQILNIEIRDEMPLGNEVLITEVDAPAGCFNRTLQELQMPRKYGVTVAAVRKAAQDTIILPTADSRIESGDVLVVLGREGAVQKLVEASRTKE